MISGATDFGALTSIVIKEDCKPAGTLDQSDNVSFVGSCISSKVTNSFLGLLLSHEIKVVKEKAINVQSIVNDAKDLKVII
jgi:hypothetical protein